MITEQMEPCVEMKMCFKGFCPPSTPKKLKGETELNRKYNWKNNT